MNLEAFPDMWSLLPGPQEPGSLLPWPNVAVLRKLLYNTWSVW